jgi:predicted TPR repeat methyltransferase
MDSIRDLSEVDLTQPVTIDDAMLLATNLHSSGHHADAFAVYTRVLAQVPNHPDALHFLGILAHHQGCDEDAVRLMKRSIALVPDHAGFRSNLGNLLLDNQRFEDAEQEYRAALAVDADRPDTLHNYGVLCKALGRYPEAERCLLRAIELTPDFIAARNALAGLYFKQGRTDEAFAQACESLAHEPKNAFTRELLGNAKCRSGHPEEAAAIYREWLAEEPDNPKALHYLAACTGQDVPERASDAYVQCVFDHFANSFDARLAMLEYRAPTLVGEAVAACAGAPAADLAVLDAGCGTGLCAPLLKPFARTLTGVDLSNGMLGKARGRNLYDDLQHAELCAYLQQHPGGYDLIVSADTLVYFGALDETMAAATRALRPGGWLCFTVEALGEDAPGDYRLQHHGRYAHSKVYLAALAQRSGLAVRRLEPVVLRHEGGLPVAGWLALVQQPGNRAAVQSSLN